MRATHPALRYFGGKWRLAKWIISHFPAHNCYVEPYGGGGSVLLRKEPAAFEVYNDLDSALVKFFRLLRERPADLIRALELFGLRCILTGEPGYLIVAAMCWVYAAIADHLILKGQGE